MTRPAVAGREALDAPERASPTRSVRRGILRLRITSDADHWTFEPEGEIDLSNAAALEQAIRRAEASAAQKITIDLCQVEFIDVSGVRVLVNAHGRLKGRLRLIEGPPAVQSIFRLTGTEDGLPFEP